MAKVAFSDFTHISNNQNNNQTEGFRPNLCFYSESSKVQGLLQVFDIKRKVILGNQL